MSLYCRIKKKINSFSLDIEFETGDETVALMGASGCGKSMTLKCIAGIITPDSGQIILDGKVLYDSEKHINLPPQKRHIGMLFQDYALFPNMTVYENICLGITGKKSKYSKSELSDKVRSYVSAYHLEGLENHYPIQLSGGQKQRCALARMMASDPEIIMLDEPFSALDSFLRWQLEQEVSNAIQSFGKTVLLVSHNRDEVFRLCSSVTVINSGKNEPIREKHDLYSNPQSYADALLTGCKNIFSASVKSGLLVIPDLNISFKKSQNITGIDYVGIRARKIVPAFEVVNTEEYIFIRYSIQSVTESVFSYILMIIPENGSKPIRWEVLKKTFSKLDDYEPVVAIHKKEFLLLKG